jgi:CheY-like chemotaxis protein
VLKYGNETILLAEDQEEVRKAVKGILEGAGYKIIEATNGAQALELFVKHCDTIALVILDVVMPVKNGKETYEEIRKIRPYRAVLFMSGYTADIIQAKVDLGDEFQFISKPVVPRQLLDRVREIISAAQEVGH